MELTQNCITILHSFVCTVYRLWLR